MKWRVALIFFFVSILLYFLSLPYFPLSSVTYGMNITIIEGQHAGLDIRNDLLYFGKVSRGGESMRQLQLRNHDSRPLRITFHAKGPFASYLYVPENGYVLQPQEERIFNVFVRVPQDAPLGSFVGKLTVSFWKA